MEEKERELKGVRKRLQEEEAMRLEGEVRVKELEGEVRREK